MYRNNPGSSVPSSRGAYGAPAAGAGGFFGSGRQAKARVNQLFMLHACILLGLGLLSSLYPEVLVFLLHHSKDGFHSRHEGGAVRIAFVVMRVFGCFLLAQSYLLYIVKDITDGKVRKAVVQSYFAAFALTTVALARAQLTEDTPARLSNWLVITLFGGLTLAYGWFALVERVVVFEGLAK